MQNWQITSPAPEQQGGHSVTRAFSSVFLSSFMPLHL